MITGMEVTMDAFWLIYLVGACLTFGAQAQFAEAYTLALYRQHPNLLHKILLVILAAFWWLPVIRLMLGLGRQGKDESQEG